jgi:osmotically-inducible protein OsmY
VFASCDKACSTCKKAVIKQMAENRTQEELKKRLSEDEQLQSKDILIHMEGETVILQGTVPHLSDKMTIIREALDTDGVSEVDDQLVVLESTTEGRPLTTRVSEVLERQTDIDTSNIDFMEKNGSVRLWGTVQSGGEKQRIEDSISSIDGTLEIHNEVSMAPEGKESDDTIAKQVVDMIEDRDDVQTEEITVEVENGVVTLSGHVATWSGKNSAIEAARYVSDVVQVVDDLTVDETM